MRCYAALPTMTTWSLGSLASTNALISPKLQMRLLGTWLSAPEYHRAPALALALLHLADSDADGRIAAAKVAPEHVLAAHEAEAATRGEMRRSRIRWQACRVAMVSFELGGAEVG